MLHPYAATNAWCGRGPFHGVCAQEEVWSLCAHVVDVPEGSVGRQRRQPDLIVAHAPGAAQAGQAPPAASRLFQACMHQLKPLLPATAQGDSLCYLQLHRRNTLHARTRVIRSAHLAGVLAAGARQPSRAAAAAAGCRRRLRGHSLDCSRHICVHQM